MTRHYLPITHSDLGAWFDAQEIPATDRYFEPPEESEAGEYAALMDAADASAALPGGDGRRMVLVIDDDSAPSPDVVPWRRVVSLHIDVEPGAAKDEELAWYATQEIGPLLHR